MTITPSKSIWTLESYRAGETTQIIGLAESLTVAFGWSHRNIRLQYRRQSGLHAILRAVGLLGVTHSSINHLVPPWPDLLISAGVRNEPVARWVRRQSDNHTALVFLGRTWASRRHFSLIVATPQYRLPAAANVLVNETTLHRVTPTRLRDTAAQSKAVFGSATAPRIVVLLGGDSGPYALRAGAAAHLAGQLQRLQAHIGGSLLITSSSRTDPAALDTLGGLLPDSFLYRYRPNDVDNPYFALLACADHVVVTSDSIAMISEAIATTRPVWLFDLKRFGDQTGKTRAYSMMMRALPARLSRDIDIAHQRLLANGRIHYLHDAAATDAPRTACAEYTDTALVDTLARIHALMAPRESAAAHAIPPPRPAGGTPDQPH